MKKLFWNLKLSKKLIIAPGVVILLLITVACLSYIGMSTQQATVESMFTVRFKNFEDVSKTINQMTQIHNNLYKMLSWVQASFDMKRIEQLGHEQMEAIKAMKGRIGEVVKTSVLSPEEKGYYQASLKELEEYEKAASQVVDMVSGDTSVATTMMINVEKRFENLNRNFQELWELEKKLSREKYSFSLTSFKSGVRMFFIALAVALGISLLVSLFLAKIITSPLRKTTNVIQQIAEGDLTQEIDFFFRDEIGMLVESVNEMRLKMGEAVGQSVSMSQSLSEAASEQAASLEEASSSLEEMTSMTRQNAGNANEANGLMSATQEVIRGANGSMSELTGSIREIGKASEETQKIVKMIDEIAFQTNLLALNAAVEAARAGETGAGFAVVADEVRNLALRAADAAKNTSRLMQDIVKKVKNGEKLVEGTNGVFLQITESSSKVVKLVGEIAVASQDQAQGIEQINKAVTQMNSVTQQNAASAEELASIMAMFKTNGKSRRTSLETV